MFGAASGRLERTSTEGGIVRVSEFGQEVFASMRVDFHETLWIDGLLSAVDA